MGKEKKTMRENTERKKRGRRAAVIAAATAALVVLVYVGSLLWMLIEDGSAPALGFGVLYGALGLAVILGAVFAARQRVRELDRGEEEEAKKY